MTCNDSYVTFKHGLFATDLSLAFSVLLNPVAATGDILIQDYFTTRGIQIFTQKIAHITHLSLKEKPQYFIAQSAFPYPACIFKPGS